MIHIQQFYGCCGACIFYFQARRSLSTPELEDAIIKARDECGYCTALCVVTNAQNRRIGPKLLEAGFKLSQVSRARLSAGRSLYTYTMALKPYKARPVIQEITRVF